MRQVWRTALAAATLGGLALGAAAPVLAADTTGTAMSRVQAGSFPGEGYAQYYGRGGYGRGGYGRRGYGRRGYGGGALAAGVVGGLAVGALAGAAIAGSQPAYGYGGYGPGAPVGNVYGHDPNWVSYCASRYRSFDPASGTYLARDGNRYVCQ